MGALSAHGAPRRALDVRGSAKVAVRLALQGLLEPDPHRGGSSTCEANAIVRIGQSTTPTSNWLHNTLADFKPESVGSRNEYRPERSLCA
jgi:hypothetical protein